MAERKGGPMGLILILGLSSKVQSAFLGRFDMMAGANGGARGFWRFPIMGRVRIRVCQALVRPDRVEGAIATPLMRGAKAARDGDPTHVSGRDRTCWRGSERQAGGWMRAGLVRWGSVSG